MAFHNNMPASKEGLLQLLTTVLDQTAMPQDVFMCQVIGVDDENGESIRTFEIQDNYMAMFFFPGDFKVDFSEVLHFKEHLDELKESNYEIVSDTSRYVKVWIIKEPSCGGLGVAMDNGNLAKVTFLIGWAGRLMFMFSMSMFMNIPDNANFRLELVQAFKHSDLTGQALASGCIPRAEVFLTDFSEKVNYFSNKFGHGRKGGEAKNNKEIIVDKSEASTSSDDESKEKTKANVNDETMGKESSDEDETSSVSTVTGPGKDVSGTSLDVLIAGKASLESNKNSVEKRNASAENEKASKKQKQG